MGSLVLAEPEISLFGRKTVQRLTMARWPSTGHLLLTLSVLLLFSILAVSAETRTMACSRRWNDPDIKDFEVNDGRRITVNATTIINTNGADFDRWYEPTISYRRNRRTGRRERQIMYRIRIPLDAVTSPGVGPRTNPEECYIDYHGPSAHNNNQGSVGSVWCKNCLNDGSDPRRGDTTNVIANDLWTLVQWTEFLDRGVLGLGLGARETRSLRDGRNVRTALTAKLRQLTEDRRYPALTTTTTTTGRPTRRGQ